MYQRVIYYHIIYYYYVIYYYIIVLTCYNIYYNWIPWDNARREENNDGTSKLWRETLLSIICVILV